jgi:hypothetical protein
MAKYISHGADAKGTEMSPVLPQSLQNDPDSCLTIDSVCLQSRDAANCPTIFTGALGELIIMARATKHIDPLFIAIRVDRMSEFDERCFTISSELDGVALAAVPGPMRLCVTMPQVSMMPGKYRMKVLITGRNFALLGGVEDYRFSVASRRNIGLGSFFQPALWSIDQ